MATPQNPDNPISEEFGLLPSIDYEYRLLPSELEVQWANGIITSAVFDKYFAIAPQGLNSQRLVIGLEFDLTLAECEKLLSALKNNKVNNVMTPSSFIDPSGLLKETILYVDSIDLGRSVYGRQTVKVNFVTDTTSSILNWRTSNFVNVDIIDEDSEVKSLKAYDIVYSDKEFFYLPRDVSEEEIEENYESDVIAAAKDICKKYYLPVDLSFQPDYFMNDYQNSYPIRAWKGESTYDYKEISVTCASMHIKQLKCALHFLEHTYGHKNFRIKEFMDDEYWWTCQQWQHSWIAGDYHSLQIVISQNHLPKNFK
jgi:hypothetical protein